MKAFFAFLVSLPLLTQVADPIRFERKILPALEIRPGAGTRAAVAMEKLSKHLTLGGAMISDEFIAGRPGNGPDAYVAMVESMDMSAGCILAELDTLGLAKNVSIIFTSDNGGLGTREGSPTSNRPLRGGKGWLDEGGIREPFLVHWPEHMKSNVTSTAPVSGNSTTNCCGRLFLLIDAIENHRSGWFKRC